MKTTYKHFIAVFAVFLALMMLLPVAVLAANYPKHENYIADEADILTEETIRMIRDTNKSLSGDYQIAIAVCTVKNTGKEDIGTYARNLFSSWKLGEGILILLSDDDDNYYFVPSVGMEDILTAETLASIRDEQFEADFANGARDRAVYKTVTKLKTTLTAGMKSRTAKAAAAEAEAAAAETPTEEKGTTAGSVIVGFFKTILWLVIIAVLLFAGVFVGAMFNDDVAMLLQKYLFRRGNTGSGRTSQNFYDDRLYGNGGRNPNGSRQNPQRRPNPNAPQNSRARQYPQQNPQNGYYGQNPNYAGYLPQAQYPQQNAYGPANGPQGQYPQNSRPMNNGGYGYPQQQYPQNAQNPQYQQNAQYYPQNPQNAQPRNNGYYAPQGQHSRPNPNQNYNTRPGYGAPQQNTDATVQFNIPRRG